MAITLNGSGTITGVTTLGTALTSPTLTTPIVTTTMGVGNATPSASGAGITFPAALNASTDANTLDDYEEGLWTPELSSTGATFTYPRGQFGSYCKVGGLVFAQFYIGATASGTTSNSCSIINLPFATANIGSLSQSSASVWVSTATPLAFTVNVPLVTSMTIWAQNAGVVQATAAQCSGGYIVGHCVYRAS